MAVLERVSNGTFDYGAGLEHGRRALGSYAASAIPSRGRLFAEPACPTRTEVQRDRDRIIHASAFRRLTYKTQMFIFHEGDNYRTRLTHSLEVAQIARTIARQLCLDEDLAEAIALAHDLGHPPFGHAGERALDAQLTDCGGYDHNVQSLRVVTSLERKYPEFDGLNLSWETLEGIVKHNGPPEREAQRGQQGHPGDAAMLHAIRRLPAAFDLHLTRQASAEAQVAAIADDIAWRTHDIDDGLRAGLIALSDLEQVTVIRPILARVADRPRQDHSRDVYEVVRQLITLMISDVVGESRRRLMALKPKTANDIREAPEPIVGLSDRLTPQLAELRTFLFAKLYRHPRIMSVMDDACSVIADLVQRYRSEPDEMIETWSERAGHLDGRKRLRLIGDFVAGMTDRFAIAEHRRLFDATPDLR
ncbi:MAG: deoxyguanosinetriphosphate triphosphohydrolase [Pseudomonadota bacterium]